MTFQHVDPACAEPYPAIIHPDSVHAPAWKSKHIQITLVRWAGGWRATADMWRHGSGGSINDWTTDDRRTMDCSWGLMSPIDRNELVEMLWRTAHRFAAELQGHDVKPPLGVRCDELPASNEWVKATAGITPGAHDAHLYVYLTGKGHSSSKPNERRLCSEVLMPLQPMTPVMLLSTLGFLVEQHAR